MKKIFLFTSIILLAFSSNIFTQTPTIDTAFIPQPIVCFGQPGNIQIQVNQTLPPTAVTCIVGRYTQNSNSPVPGTTTFITYQNTFQTTGSPVSVPGFPAIYTSGSLSGQTINYFVRIVDSATYYSTHPGGNGSSTVGILDEFGIINFSTPNQLGITRSVVASNICFGECIASEELTISGGTQPYNYILDANAQVIFDPTVSVDTINALCGGNYSITFSDANGCLTTPQATLFSISEPTELIATVSKTNVNCFGGNDGKATVTPTGGIPIPGPHPYTYSWSPSGGTDSIALLTQGTYTCIITDAAGCSFTTPPIVITEPEPLMSGISNTALTCPNTSDGTATVNPSGGTPFAGGIYIYSWSTIPEQTDANALNLEQGTYTCIINAANGCPPITRTTTISPQENSILFDTLIITPATCSGHNNAQIEIIVSGGQPPYSYSNDGGLTNQLSQTFPLLADATYDIIVSDNLCYIDTAIEIYTELLIDSTYFIDPSCNGANDGEILSIDVLGGIPPFEYSVNGSTHYSNMAYFNGYAPGTYTVEVFDVNNCVAADYIIITEPDELVVDITTSGWVFNSNSGLYSYQIRCNGDSSGFANFTINGGTAPYTRNLYNATVDTLITTTSLNYLDNLFAGEYEFEVIDANGCTYSETIIFSEPSVIVHNFIPTHVTCSEWNNGSLIDSVYGGVGDATTYTYLWSNSETTYTINNIGIGEYSIEVIDENNCISLGSFLINDDNALAASVGSFIDISCYDYCDGEIFANPLGGGPDIDSLGNSVYYYQWDDILLQTTDTAIGLCADNTSDSAQYSCIITDGQGCSVAVTQILSQPDSLYVTTRPDTIFGEDISCYGASDGVVISDVEGGSAPYTYTWNTVPEQTTNSATGLPADTFTVVVTDYNGCMDSTEIILTQPDSLYITVSDTSVTCFGFNDGKIVADADGGVAFFNIPPEYLYTLKNQMGTPVYSVQDSFILAENLSPAIYTVTATDQNGCSITSGSIFISQPIDLLTLNLDSIDESCSGDNGVVISDVEGGSAPYTYTWSNEANDTDTSISGLSPGSYSVVVVDYNGCVINGTIRVNGSDEVFLPGNISSFDTTICLGTTFKLNVEEKDTLFTYVWRNGNDTLLNKTINSLTNDSADIVVTPVDYINIYTLNISDPNCPNAYEVAATINVDFIDPMPASEPGVEYGAHPIILAGDNLVLYSENNTCVEYTWQWTNDTILNNNGSITINDLQKTDWYHLNVKDSEDCLGYDSIYVIVGVKPYEAITPNNDGFNDTWTPLDIESYENALVQVFNRWGGLVFESKGGENYQAWDGTNSGKELAVGTYYYIIDLNTGDAPQTGPITIIR